eukprot:9874870-Alexandrium_andersonii.AAC.1
MRPCGHQAAPRPTLRQRRRPNVSPGEGTVVRAPTDWRSLHAWQRHCECREPPSVADSTM